MYLERDRDLSNLKPLQTLVVLHRVRLPPFMNQPELLCTTDEAMKPAIKSTITCMKKIIIINVYYPSIDLITNFLS